MTSLKSRIAVAAALAALSVPALAADTENPFPALGEPAPSVALGAQGDEAQVLNTDPTWPETDGVAPAIALVPHLADGPVFSAADRPTPDTIEAKAESVHYAVEFGAQSQRVATSR